MRLYPKGFSLLLPKIKASLISGVLLYGPDKGMIEHFIQEIQNLLSLKTRKVEYAEITGGHLSQALNSLSLFETREIVVIKNFGSSLDKENKQTFDKAPHNFPILVADELSPSSSLRQFFEKHDMLASIACYSETSSDLQPIVMSYLKRFGKSIAPDALKYVCENLNNDRKLLYGELEKLSTYCHDVEKITLEHVQKLILPSKNMAIDSLCISFANKDASNYFCELDNLFSNNAPEMLVIRSLIRYYANIYTVKLYNSKGVFMDEAIKLLSPPIFFLYVQQFKNIVTKINLAEVRSTLKTLVMSEIELKSGAKISKHVFENIFYQRS
jgi:DNA polymerase-3 subunit delta